MQTVQQPGDIIVTSYEGYHMGYNMGFSVSESFNYATENWKPYYEKAKQCSCELVVIIISSHHSQSLMPSKLFVFR